VSSPLGRTKKTENSGKHKPIATVARVARRNVARGNVVRGNEEACRVKLRLPICEI